MSTTVRKYDITHADNSPSPLSVSYEIQNNKEKFIGFYSSENTEVKVSQIWFNGLFQASYLKNLQIPSRPDNLRYVNKQEESYHLKVQNWNGLSETITFKYRRKEDENTFSEVPTCLKVLGLKQAIGKKIGALIGNQNYLLIYRSHQLDDEMTIGEYGIENNDVIEVVTPVEMAEGDGFLQAGVVSNYESVETFQRIYKEIDEKINAVCQIKIGAEHGTGFLIGKYLIITNHHVIKNGLEGGKAIFFYNSEKNQDQIEVGLDSQVICRSPFPKDGQEIHSGALDYAILRLNHESLESKEKKRLDKIAEIGEKIFKNADSAYERKKGEELKASTQEIKARVEQQIRRKNRAHIIQHPLHIEKGVKRSQPKQIAFRENHVIEKPDGLILHCQARTEGASSGSPGFNDCGEWIAVHFSKCTKISQLLFEFQKELFDELKFSKTGEDIEKYQYEKTGEECVWVCTGELKGKYSKDQGKTTFPLQKFVKEYVEKEKFSTFEEFVTKFLAKHSGLNPEILKHHINCSIAIDVDQIFRDLKKEKKWKEIQNALIKDEQQNGIQGMRLIFGLIAIGVVAGICFKIYKSAKG